MPIGACLEMSLYRRAPGNLYADSCVFSRTAAADASAAKALAIFRDFRLSFLVITDAPRRLPHALRDALRSLRVQQAKQAEHRVPRDDCAARSMMKHRRRRIQFKGGLLYNTAGGRPAAIFLGSPWLGAAGSSRWACSLSSCLKGLSRPMYNWQPNFSCGDKPLINGSRKLRTLTACRHAGATTAMPYAT